MAILYRILPSNGKVFHGYAWIHFVFFLGFIPWFYTFPTKTPPCRFPAGDGTGGGALDKVGRDCYDENRKSVATSG